LKDEDRIVVYNARIRQRKLPLIRLPEAETERAGWLVFMAKASPIRSSLPTNLPFLIRRGDPVYFKDSRFLPRQQAAIEYVLLALAPQ
jgi:hypothetical protein